MKIGKKWAWLFWVPCVFGKSEKAMAAMAVQSEEKMETKLGLKKENNRKNKIEGFLLFP